MKENNKENRINQTMSNARIISTVSVICAHMPLSNAYSSVAKHIFLIVASIGAPMFFFISAYYFRPTKYDNIGQFLKKRCLDLLPAWFISGVVIYTLYNYSCFSVIELVKWVLGVNSYLWYMPVLFLCYIMFYWMSDNTPFLVAISLVSVGSLILTASKLLDFLFSSSWFSAYLLVTNWSLFFALGILSRKYRVLEKLLTRRIAYVLSIPFVLAAFILCNCGCASGYFYYYGFLIEILGILFICGISLFIPHMQLVENLSRSTYSVYLYHFVGIWMVGKVFTILNKHGFIRIEITKIICVILLMYAFFFLVSLLCKRTETYTMGRILFGMKPEKKESSIAPMHQKGRSESSHTER